MTNAKPQDVQTVRPYLQPLDEKGKSVDKVEVEGEIRKMQHGKYGAIGEEGGEPDCDEVRTPKSARKPRTPT